MIVSILVHILIFIFYQDFFLKLSTIHWACGAMENASNSGSEDSRSESWQARLSLTPNEFFFFFFTFYKTLPTMGFGITIPAQILNVYCHQNDRCPIVLSSNFYFLFQIFLKFVLSHRGFCAMDNASHYGSEDTMFKSYQSQVPCSPTDILFTKLFQIVHYRVTWWRKRYRV